MKTWGLGVLLCALAGCTATSYVAQAGVGQLDLRRRAEPIESVLADGAVSDEARGLLAEVPRILEFARAQGLDTKGNYEDYVDLPRAAAVWFVAASKPLAFEAKEWSFPIVGSFNYLGWFDFREALRFRRRLKNEGWDVLLRGARAFSTGGWFRDPVLSTMFLGRGEKSRRSLIGVLFHELTHANILINDQSTFNESVASFVGDTMARSYLLHYDGVDSEELRIFDEEVELDRERGTAYVAAYAELDAIYKGASSDASKLEKKQAIMNRLQAELDLVRVPNNAMLIGFRTYNAGMEELGQLFRHCDEDWPRFLATLASFEPEDFPEAQDEKIAPVITRRLSTPCRGQAPPL